MAGIDDYRSKRPEYNDLSDHQLADALYKRGNFEAEGMTREQFFQAFGVDPTVDKRTTAGMSTWESTKELTRTGAQYGAAKLAAIPQAITQIESTRYTMEDINAARDEYNAAHPDRPVNRYASNPDLIKRARELAVARDPSNKGPVFGETVKKFGQEHLVSADDVLRHMAEVSKRQGGTGQFTRPTEMSGRILQHGVEAATMAAPALLTGQPEALLMTGAAAAGGQGVREAGGPEWAAQGLEIGGSMLTPGGIASAPRMVRSAVGATVDRTLPANATRLLNEAVKGMTEAELSEAQALMRRAASSGTENRLTWAEAANQITDGRIKALTDLQRVVEASGANDALNAVMAGRETAAARNVEQQATRLGGAPLEGAEARSLPRRVGAQAEAGIQDLKNARQAEVGPIYQRGEARAVDEVIAPRYDDWMEVLGRPDAGTAFRRAQNISRNRGEPISQFLEFNDAGEITRLRQVPSAADLDSIHKSLQAMINDKNILADARNGLIKLRDDFDALADEAVPEYARGRARHAELSGPITDVEAGPLGTIKDVAGRDATATGEQQMATISEAILPKKPQLTDPRTAGETVRTLRQGRDPVTRQAIPGAVDPVAGQTVAKILRTRLNEARSQFKTKMNAQDAGAAFKVAVSGNPEQRAILQQVITQAGGDDAWRGFSNMLDIFEAQGWRQVPGSQTTFNQMIRDTMEQSRLGMSVPEAAVAIGSGGSSVMMRGLRGLEKRAASKRGAATVDELATRLLDPENLPILRQLATMSPYSPNALRLVGQLIGAGAATASTRGAQPWENLSPGYSYPE